MRRITSINTFKTGFSVLLICGLVFLQGCSDTPDDPASEIKSMLAAFEQAAEERSITGVSAYLAEDYMDKHHRNSQQVKRSLLGYFHRHRSIYLFTNIKSITLSEETEQAKQAKAIVNVAMTGTQVDSEEALLLLKADVYSFNLDLVKEDDQWLVKSSSWKRIKITEF
jgi:hypothetical protein